MADNVEQRNWNGARWWKFDFHTHTPASDDYGKGGNQEALRQRTEKEWLLDFMRAEIDCVAVTDHNSGAWIDPLQDALKELKVEKPADFRPLHLFTGVEISVHGGVHLLAVFGSDFSTQGISKLLDAIGYEGTEGSSDGVTTKSFPEVAREIEARGGLAIPAHVDQARGLFEEYSGTTLKQALDCDSVFAIELTDASAEKPGLFRDKVGSSRERWAEVVGSDSHHPTGQPGERFPGSHYTWVKMDEPSLTGLRLALLDGPLSIKRFDDPTVADPNEHADLLLESIEVKKARYMGRVEPFVLSLNPWLNALIGGRGTGKSTLVEFLRIALRREGELPGVLEEDFEKYTRIYPDRQDGGLLTDRTEIRVVYRKNGTRFLLQWSPSADLEPIRQDVGGEWQTVDGIAAQFPVRMFSQKQIFYMASETLALLGVVDDAIRDDLDTWRSRWREEERRYLSLRSKARELQAALEDEPRLRGELADVKRKLEIFEEASHAEVLKTYQQRQRQERVIDSWTERWSDLGDRLRQTAQDLVPNDLADTLQGPREEEKEILRLSRESRGRLTDLQERLEDAAAQADEVLADWKRRLKESSWRLAVSQALAACENLEKQLEKEGVGEPSQYGSLVQQRQSIEQRLARLNEHRQQVQSLGTQADASLERLQELRRDLTEYRRAFLADVLEQNQYVRIEVTPYGARDAAKEEFRRLIQREGESFEKDIGEPGEGGLMGSIYSESVASPSESQLANVKEQVRRIAQGDYDPSELGDNRFATHLGKLTPESLDRLDTWFPQDALDVRYSAEGDGRHFRPIQEGSPGQKTAALLAFLLSYGDEPLVLDQPEDDLDNHLIYDLIVTQLREIKRRRQVIVVTHNANIVVNGDAELVVALQALQGQTQIECAGGLQQQEVRETICEVMEGGRKAFEQRYRRIALEGRHV